MVLKLSRVEGMYGPPLEGFHMGATCVTTPVTGHEEYVEHGWNGLVVDWDDARGTARQLDLLARDRRLLHFLRTTRSRPRAAGRRGSSRPFMRPCSAASPPGRHPTRLARRGADAGRGARSRRGAPRARRRAQRVRPPKGSERSFQPLHHQATENVVARVLRQRNRPLVRRLQAIVRRLLRR